MCVSICLCVCPSVCAHMWVYARYVGVCTLCGCVHVMCVCVNGHACVDVHSDCCRRDQLASQAQLAHKETVERR